MAATLANELLDEIVNHLHPKPGEGKADLRACTLVARSWTAVAQEHLFRHVYVDLPCPSLEQRFGKLGLGCEELPASPPPTTKLSAFVKFLKEHPQLGASIRHLQLHQSTPRQQSRHNMLDADHFATLLRMTPNVHKLFLSDIWLIFPDYFVYPAYRTSLLHLELSYPSFEPSSSDMVCLLRFFEDIRLLTWRHCGLTHMEYMTHPSALPPPPVVKQLTVEGIDVEAAEFDNLPANLIDFDHLERVELVPNGPFYAIYYDVLEKAASTMRHLRMYLVQGYGADGYGTPARLVSNALRGPRLEELLLEIDLKLPYVAYSIETLAEVLSAAQITANQFPALRRLVLIFHFDRDTHELPEPEPEELDLDFETDIDRMLVEIVSQSHAAKIECRWHELYNPLGEDLEACLRKIFPRLIEQKALELIQIPAQDPR